MLCMCAQCGCIIIMVLALFGAAYRFMQLDDGTIRERPSVVLQRMINEQQQQRSL